VNLFLPRMPPIMRAPHWHQEIRERKILLAPDRKVPTRSLRSVWSLRSLLHKTTAAIVAAMKCCGG